MAQRSLKFPSHSCNVRQKMGPDRVQSKEHFKTKTSFLKVHVLVVDDDSTSLAIVSAILKKCSQRDSIFELSVVTVRSPLDALSTLRLQQQVFDMVVTDLHMPEMNGIELQKHVNEEFKLPVVIMSSDDKESTITESLESGAAGYIVKPAKADDLKNVWQHAVSAKKGKSIAIREIVERGSSSSSHNEDVDSSSSVNDAESGQNKKKKKKKTRVVGDEEENPAAPRKAKVVWTDALHNRFLHALHHLGLERAVPKKILAFMNVPGLTRENIASHLQKYRIFLQRVTDKRANTSNSNFSKKRSVFASGEANFMLNNLQQKMRTSIQSGPGGSAFSSVLTSSRFSSPGLPTFLASSALQGRYGATSRSLGNPARVQPPMFGKAANLLYQENSTRLMGMKSNSSMTNLPFSQGHIPHSLTNIATSGLPNAGPTQMQMRQQQNQARLLNIDKMGAPFQNKLGSGVGNMGTINSSYSFPSNNSCTGIRMTGYGGLIEPGQNVLNWGEASSGCNIVQGLVNWNSYENMYVAPMGKGPLGFSAESVNPTTGFASATTDQCPPGFAPANQQNISMLPPLSQQQHGLVGNGSMLPPLSPQQHELGRGGEIIQNQNTPNDIYTFGDISNLQPFGEGDLGLDSSSLELTGHLNPYQQQGGATHLNDNFLGSAYYAEGNTSSMNGLMNRELSSSYDTGAKAPSNNQSSGQLHDGGRVENFVPNDISVKDYNPTIDQIWTDEFLDSFYEIEP